VAVLHERYGLVQHTVDLARKLAEAGLVGCAPNLFSRWQGDREALRRGDVRVTLPDPEVAGILGETIDFLRGHQRVDGDRLALIGVCQSGRYVPVVSSERDDLAACVVLYGSAQESDWEVNEWQPRPLGEMLRSSRAPVLFIYGEADHVISLADVQKVRTALESGRRSYRMRVFPNMPHGWLNDTMPGRYRPDMAAEAWSNILVFLEEGFERRWPPKGRVRWEFQADLAPDYDFSRNVRYE
jgi:carboxymethylenebutenolidase